MREIPAEHPVAAGAALDQVAAAEAEQVGFALVAEEHVAGRTSNKHVVTRAAVDLDRHSDAAEVDLVVALTTESDDLLNTGEGLPDQGQIGLV